MMELQTFEDVAVLDLKGEIGPKEVERLSRALFSLLRKRHRKMILNFARVEHVQYPCIRPLVEAISKLRRYRGDLKFAEMNAYNRRIFCFVGAQDLIENFETVSEAVLSFRADWRTWH